MKTDKISGTQKVYKFIGNNHPYLFLSTSHSMGFIKNEHFYKEVIIKDGEEIGNIEYVRTNDRVFPETSMWFKHIVNFFYYLVLVIIVFSAYVTDNFLVTVVLGSLFGIALEYVLRKNNTIVIAILILFSITIILSFIATGFDGAPYIAIYAVIFSIIYGNIMSKDIVYKVDSNSKGFYIWTNGVPAYTVHDRIENKVSIEDNAIIVEIDDTGAR